MKRFVYAISAFVGLCTIVCLAAPEPAIVQEPDQWTLKVNFEHPQQIILPRTMANKPERFWYTIVTLTNKTGHDVGFYPKCELMTDTFQIMLAGKSVPNEIFKRIKLRHQVQYPFLEFLERTSHKMLEGEDNAKDIAIIWPDFDNRAKNIKIFIAGPSNETVVINHPTAKDEAGNSAKVFLRKTLELNYNIGGDPAFRSDAKLAFKGKRWVMR